MKIWKK